MASSRRTSLSATSDPTSRKPSSLPGMELQINCEADAHESSISKRCALSIPAALPSGLPERSESIWTPRRIRAESLTNPTATVVRQMGRIASYAAGA